MLDDLLIFLHIVYLTYLKTFFPFFDVCYYELNFSSANRNPSAFLSCHEWVNCDIHFMYVVLCGCSQEKFVCVTVSHDHRVYLLF